MPSINAHPPRGLLRWLFHLPIWLYRLGLGWMMGNRFLLLTHTGRTSGQLRQTVIEVVDHLEEADAYIIASGWGEKSDWFKNLQKKPQVLVQVGSKKYEALAVRLSLEEAQRALYRYAGRHPAAFRELTSFMLGERLQPGEEACRKVAEKIPLIALHHRDG